MRRTRFFFSFFHLESPAVISRAVFLSGMQVCVSVVGYLQVFIEDYIHRNIWKCKLVAQLRLKLQVEIMYTNSKSETHSVCRNHAEMIGVHKFQRAILLRVYDLSLICDTVAFSC